MDYYYLGIAGLGIFILAINYSEQRVAYQQQYSSLQARERMNELRGATVKYVATVCDVSAAMDIEHCWRAKGWQRVVDERPSLVELRAHIGAFREFNDRATNAIDPRLLQAELAAESKNATEQKLSPNDASQRAIQVIWRQIGAVNANYVILCAEAVLSDMVKSKEVTTSKVETFFREWELGRIALGLGQTVLWPFVLAIAFALRLTKVTIDVYKWTRD